MAPRHCGSPAPGSPPLRVLLAGRWEFPIYEAAFAGALARHGIEVYPFAWKDYLSGVAGRAAEKWMLPGPQLARINRTLIDTAVGLQPDVIFVWRGTVIERRTIEALRAKTTALLVGYTNDDPFSWREQRLPLHHRRTWRRYLDAASAYDVQFVYRAVNIAELERAGARAVHVLKPYFVPQLHHPIELSMDERIRFRCTAVFVGHYEDDGRASCIQALAGAGVHVRVFGGRGWAEALGQTAADVGPIVPVEGEDYARALAAAQAGLCFLSRLNRDTYTRRCFEIPACGTVLVSERTSDLQRLFLEDEEAVFFSSADELVRKITWLAGHPDAARRIAAAGHARVHADGHSVDGRAAEWLRVLKPRLQRESAGS